MIWVLGGLAAAAVWAVRAYFWPFAPCSWCKGNGRNAGSSRKRFGKCWACKGSGTRQVLGSRSLHRSVAAVRGKKWRTK